MQIKDALALFLEDFRKQRDIERKKREFTELTQKKLNYTLIEEIVAAAARQQPGFYSVLTFPDGTKWEFGIKDKPARKEGEAF